MRKTSRSLFDIETSHFPSYLFFLTLMPGHSTFETHTPKRYDVFYTLDLTPLQPKSEEVLNKSNKR
jgi:hypothetical protein